MKNAYWILVCICTVASIATKSQTIRFKKTYDHNGGAEWARTFLQLPNDTLLVSSIFVSPQQEYGLLLSKVDGQGNLLDTTEYCRSPYNYANVYQGSLVLMDSSYYVGGAVQWPDASNPNQGYLYPFLAKYNLQGDTVWVRHIIPDTAIANYQVSLMRKTRDGGLVFAGSVATANPGFYDWFLLKTDTGGTIVFKKTYGTLPTDDLCISVEELPDSSLLLSGMKHFSGTFPDLNYRPWIIHTDKNGIVRASKLYSWPSMHYGGVIIKPSAFGNYYILGYTDSIFNSTDERPTPYIAKLDQDFNIQRRFFFNAKMFTEVVDYVELPNGNIVFCGEKKDSATNHKDGFIAQIDSLGALLWWRTYSESLVGESYLSCVRPAPDGGFIASGTAFGQASGNQDAWVIRTDSNGCVVANCTLAVAGPIKPRLELSLYPNPANNFVTLSLENRSWTSQTAVMIYDVNGRKMSELTPEVGSSRIEIATSSWKPGTYHVLVRVMDGKSAATTLIVEHE